MGRESNLKTVRAEAVAKVGEYLEGLEGNPFKRLSDSSLPELYEEEGIRRNVVGWKVEIECHGGWQKIIVALDKHFPDSLPNIYFPEPPFPVPHISVDRDNHVCYANNEGAALIAENPIGIVFSALEEASQVIDDGLSRANLDEFDLEFQRYWSKESIPPKGMSLLKPSAKSEIAVLLTIDPPLGGHLYLIANTKEEGEQWLKNVGRKIIGSQESLVYLPLNVPIRPPFPKNKKELYHLLCDKFPERLKELFAYMRVNKKDREIALLFSFPIKGKYIYFGLRFLRANFFKKRGPAIKGYRNQKVTPRLEMLSGFSETKTQNFDVDRVDVERLQARVGNNNTARFSKSVCVIGCGSIGSKVAASLALSGISRLLFIDNDKLSLENVARHICPMSASGQHKVEALAETLLCKMPQLEIISKPLNILDVLDNNLDFFDGYDLIISATGDRTTNFRLNEIHQAYLFDIPVLYTWIEAYGFASHSVLSVPAKGGCFQCLFDNSHEYRFRLINTKADALLEVDAGCGSSFLPFGAVDSDIAAAYSSKLSLEVLDEKISRGREWTYIGDVKEAQNTGLDLSGEYKNQSFHLIQRLFPRRLTCKKCK